jgi:hypothetical protein
MTCVSKDAVLKLLFDIGVICAEFQNKALRSLARKRIECDEIWSSCCAKQKNIPLEKEGQFGMATFGRGSRLTRSRIWLSVGW